ncbi:MAG TPA: hypothetical protein VNO52_09290 [Methylomirabilota bacterium]|nr:hypothetical protein [Methylomirabilota bacterium]
MGLLNLLSRSDQPALMTLPTGSFVLDREGNTMTSTLPRSFPAQYTKDIGTRVLQAFQKAREAHLPLTELTIHYGAFKVLARELRGGAMIFLMPVSTPPTQAVKSN